MISEDEFGLSRADFLQALERRRHRHPLLLLAAVAPSAGVRQARPARSPRHRRGRGQGREPPDLRGAVRYRHRPGERNDRSRCNSTRAMCARRSRPEPTMIAVTVRDLVDKPEFANVAGWAFGLGVLGLDLWAWSGGGSGAARAGRGPDRRGSRVVVPLLAPGSRTTSNEACGCSSPPGVATGFLAVLWHPLIILGSRLRRRREQSPLTKKQRVARPAALGQDARRRHRGRRRHARRRLRPPLPRSAVGAGAVRGQRDRC